jgi:hypothetical protein
MNVNAAAAVVSVAADIQSNFDFRMQLSEVTSKNQTSSILDIISYFLQFHVVTMLLKVCSDKGLLHHPLMLYVALGSICPVSKSKNKGSQAMPDRALLLIVLYAGGAGEQLF